MAKKTIAELANQLINISDEDWKELNEYLIASGLVLNPVKAAETTPPPKCPKGYYWNGSECVLDVG